VIHHIGVFASDFEARRAFYTAALRPLGLAAHYQPEDTSEFWRHGQDTRPCP
jgi:catechol 2,3-dioxygenase-like lactoylglutathione lyase family enzyme